MAKSKENQLSAEWTKKLQDRDFAFSKGYEAAGRRLDEEAEEAGRRLRAERARKHDR